MTHLLLVAALVTAPAATPALDQGSIDRSVDPCTDFYQYACAGWMQKHPIPADQSRWGRFNVLYDENLTIERELLETAAKDTKRDADTQKIGDFYAACMDEGAIEKKGLAPIEPLRRRIAALKSTQEFPALLAALHDAGVGGFFRFGPTADYKNAGIYIAVVDQSGLGLPDRDYYFRDDEKSVEQREKYLQHVQKTLALAGAGPKVAAARAQAIMALETRLAKGSLDRVGRRDPNNRYHKLPKKDLATLTPAFAWDTYLVGAPAAPSFDSLNVAWPAFFEAMQGVLAETPLDDLKAYLEWSLLRDSAPLLPRAFVAESFAFYDQTLGGAKELKPRWKRCVELTDRALGEALGRAYVERTFGAEGKARVLALVGAIEKSLGDDLRQLDWMGDDTKKQALVKLAAIANKIGYPDKWRDYSAMTIERRDALGNGQRAAAFEVHRQLRKIGTAVDPSEWRMTPATVNAYYNSTENNINFPAGILQPPFFNRAADDAVNLGGIGVVIGHELTHGFDDQGRKFDAVGNLRDWWTAEDNGRFEERAKCLVDEYGGFVAIDDVKLNGKLTLGENTADNGGARVAFMALRDLLATKEVAAVDGYTAAQRFFLGFAQVWCENSTPEVKRLRAQTDPHSPGRYRVNGTVANMPEFREAFGCKAPPASQCRVW